MLRIGELENGVDPGIPEAVGAERRYRAAIATESILLEPGADVTQGNAASMAHNHRFHLAAVMAIGVVVYQFNHL